MAAAVWVVGVLPFIMWNWPSWYCTMSATACVSAAEPDRQHQMVSWTRVSLSVTRFAMYAPVVVRESAPDGRTEGQLSCVWNVWAACDDMKGPQRRTEYHTVLEGDCHTVARMLDVGCLTSVRAAYIEVPRLQKQLALTA